MAIAQKIGGMKFSCASLIIGFLLVGGGRCYSQGITNLNFESANVSGYSPGPIPTVDAFPDWSAYYGSSSDPTHSGSLSTVFYDGLSLGGAVVSVEDSNAPSPYGPIGGNYSALLWGSIQNAETTASIGQTGTIPSTAQSLVLWVGISEPEVSFDGQVLLLVDVSNAVNYTVYALDISPFAGQTGQLLFTAPVQSETILDNIQFSTSPIPEPSTLALCALGALSLVWRLRKKSSE
jgi:hypothetical protein